MNILIKAITLGAVSVISVINGTNTVNKSTKHMQAKGTFEVKILPAEGTALEKDCRH